jgi:hypothetical protein
VSGVSRAGSCVSGWAVSMSGGPLQRLYPQSSRLRSCCAKDVVVRIAFALSPAVPPIPSSCTAPWPLEPASPRCCRRAQLSETCAATLFDQEQVMAGAPLVPGIAGRAMHRPDLASRACTPRRSWRLPVSQLRYCQPYSERAAADGFQGKFLSSRPGVPPMGNCCAFFSSLMPYTAWGTSPVLHGSRCRDVLIMLFATSHPSVDATCPTHHAYIMELLPPSFCLRQKISTSSSR